MSNAKGYNMAIVFISPRAKRKTFIRAAAILMFFILMIAVVVILFIASLNRKQAGLSPVPPAMSDVSINFNIIDSTAVSNLEPFLGLEMEFAYVVEDNDGKQVTGNISAVSQEAARDLLGGAGFKVISIQEMQIGRTEPFMAY